MFSSIKRIVVMESYPRKCAPQKTPPTTQSCMVNDLRSSVNKHSGRAEIKLPYKLLRFPSSGCVLWNHTSVGESSILHLFNNRIIKLHLEKPVLKLGYDHALSNVKQLNQFTCKLCGKIVISENEKDLTFTFINLKCSEKDQSSVNVSQLYSLTDCQAYAKFSVECVVQSENNMRLGVNENATKKILNCISKKGALMFHHYVLCSLHCHFLQKFNEILCHLVFSAETLSSTLRLCPISPITIIPTALSKGLGDPVGNKFLHGEPKSGYLTMDEIHRLLLVLDSDPKVASLPILGIWVSGVQSLLHPYVWTACIRYLHSPAIHQRICSPPDPFLVVIYEKPIYVPKFYDCFLEDFSLPLSSVLYSGSVKTVFNSTIDIKPDDGVYFILEKVLALHPTTSKKLVLNSCQKSENFQSVASQKPYFSPKSLCPESDFIDWSQLVGCVPTPGSVVSSTTQELCTTDVVNHIKDKCEKIDTCQQSEENGVKSHHCCRPSPYVQNIVSPRNLLENSELKQDLYGLILAQEQQLRKLKEQLGCLLREQQQVISRPSDIQNSASRMDQAKTSTATVHSRHTISAGTMTSFVWPLHSPCAVTKTPNTTPGKENRTEVAVTEQNFPSPENERRQPLADSFNSPIRAIEDSLLNVQLPTFVESVGSAQSSILIDVPEYPESISSYSQHSNYNSDNEDLRQDQFGQPPLKESDPKDINMTSNYMDSSMEESAFYDNLMKRIQAILLKQDLQHDGPVEYGNDTDRPPLSSLPSKEWSAFDSLLIPHLNYVSLLSSDSDCDQSAEFRSLALKYLKQPGDFWGPFCLEQQSVLNNDTMSSVFTLCKTSKSNFSFASNQYLRKHGLKKSK